MGKPGFDDRPAPLVKRDPPLLRSKYRLQASELILEFQRGYWRAILLSLLSVLALFRYSWRSQSVASVGPTPWHGSILQSKIEAGFHPKPPDD